jgi:hypothetical protein
MAAAMMPEPMPTVTSNAAYTMANTTSATRLMRAGVPSMPRSSTNIAAASRGMKSIVPMCTTSQRVTLSEMAG